MNSVVIRYLRVFGWLGCEVEFCSCRFFVFQAEDGIRDLVRSRGLGDVYKRQVQIILDRVEAAGGKVVVPKTEISPDYGYMGIFIAVSYTHLTLPTSDLV